MYELLVRLNNELDYKKYTIEDLEEIKEILKDLQTQEVRLKRMEDQYGIKRTRNNK